MRENETREKKAQEEAEKVRLEREKREREEADRIRKIREGEVRTSQAKDSEFYMFNPPTRSVSVFDVKKKQNV